MNFNHDHEGVRKAECVIACLTCLASHLTAGCGIHEPANLQAEDITHTHMCAGIRLGLLVECDNWKICEFVTFDSPRTYELATLEGFRGVKFCPTLACMTFYQD